MPAIFRNKSTFLISKEFPGEMLEPYTSFTALEKVVVFKGTKGNDQIDGEDRDERFYGLAGNDKISALGGDDYLNGGSGNDYLNGGLGKNVMIGGTGNDRIYARAGDLAKGGPGDDFLDGYGSARLYGNAGNDTFELSDGAIAWGGDGDDTFIIHHRLSTTHGGAGFDTVKIAMLSKHYDASYDDGVLSLTISEYSKYDGFYRPRYEHHDNTIERIAFKDLALDVAHGPDKPVISAVYTGHKEMATSGETIHKQISYLLGEADAFARVRVMANGVVIGTCVANEEGEWYLRKFTIKGLPDGSYDLTATADFGDKSKAQTSQVFELEIDLPDTNRVMVDDFAFG